MNKYKKTKCALCGCYDNYKVLYPDTSTEKNLNKEIFSARRLPDRIHYQIVKCNEDGLTRSNPTGDTSKLTTLYKESKFTYQEETNNLTKTYLNAMASILIKIPKNSNILEIGCGNGFVLESLYKNGYKNVFGIEPSSDAINNAPKAIKNKIKQGILNKNSFKKNKFDFIFFFQTFDHIPDPNIFLKICHNLLKKKGYILAFNHNVNSLSSRILGEKSPIYDIEHTYLYNYDTIGKIFENNNFKKILCFFPSNIISIKHLIWLLPLPHPIKNKLINTKNSFLEKNLKIKLGNLCYIGQKKT